MSQDILAKTQELVRQIKEGRNSENYLLKALNDSLATLKSPTDNPGEGQSTDVDLSTPTSNAEEYAKMLGGIAESFSGLFSELKETRSSYLPDYFTNKIETNDDANTFQEFTNAESFMESYENTFLRMLGLPSSSDIYTGETLYVVEPSGELKTSDENIFMGILDERQTKALERSSPGSSELYALTREAADPFDQLTNLDFNNLEELKQTIDSLKKLFAIDDMQSDSATALSTEFIQNLNSSEGEVYPAVAGEEEDEYTATVRQQYAEVVNAFVEGIGPRQDGDDTRPPPKTFGYAKRIVEAALYVADANSYPEVSEETKGLLTYYVLGIEDPSLASLNEMANFWRFSRLLFPPVNDERIGQCINETEKIIAEPFLPFTMRRINGRTMRTSLLEAVIRIRIDIISGSSVSQPIFSSQPSISASGRSSPITYQNIADSYGVLESMIIVRLFNAMAGLAKEVSEKIKEVQQVQEESGVRTDASAPGAPDGSGQPGAGEAGRDGGNNTQTRIRTPEEIARYDAIMALDDAILFLLGKNSINKAIDYQLGTARNSEVVNAQVMDSIISVITVPGKWAKSKSRIRDSENIEDSRARQEPDRARIDSTLGVARGIGIIDVMAFSIALFTIPEATLLGLLNERQKENMKLEFPSGFFDEFFGTIEGKKRVSDAVNELSEAAYDAYDLFRLFLTEADEGIFVVD